MKVGLIGLGVMGSAIGGLMVRAGAEVWGCDVDEARRDQLRAIGGRIVASPAEAARGCPVVLTSLPTAEAFHQVVSGPDGITAAGTGPTVVDLSTLSIADKQRGRAALARAGAHLVDSPLSGTGAQAKFGDLVAYVSADDPVDRERAIDVLALFTRAQYDVGAFGNGSRFKFVANLLVAIHNVAAAEALVLAERAGLDLGLVLTAVADGAGGSRMLDIRGPLMTVRSYDEATVRLSVFGKDIRLIGEFAGSVGATTPLFAASRAIYDTAMAGGRADQDSACVAEVLRSGADGADGQAAPSDTDHNLP
jgi:3-hydroxyisobutyrate dehydrogenase-like beta-hydroxyacid dehydrogenase